MSAVQIPDDLQRAINHAIEQGRATSTVAFVHEAVLRLLDEAQAEEDEISRAAQAGIADIEAGRFTTVELPEDSEALSHRLTARLRKSLSAET